jgi:hypothetical protein
MAPNKEKFFLTPIKRSHLVLTNGVGSLVRTRSKITALICDLHQWEKMIPTGKALGVDKDAVRAQTIGNNKIRDGVLEDAAGIDFLVSPPSFPDDGSSKRDWCLPLVRFPLAQVCSNGRCNRLSFAQASDSHVHSGKSGCKECGSKTIDANNKTTKGRMKRQVTVMLVCPDGHIDEIDFVALAHGVHKGGDICGSPDIRVTFGFGPKRPVAKCITCGKSGGGEKLEFSCTGRRPWIVGVSTPDQACKETMRVVERTSVQLYYSSTKSAIFLPEDGIDERLLRWMAAKVAIEHIDRTVKDSRAHQTELKKAQDAGFVGLTLDQFNEHIDRAFPIKVDGTDPHWDAVLTKASEFDRFTDPSQKSLKSELLEFHHVDDFGGSSFLGSGNRVDRVVSVEKLAETRMLDGFSRWRPKNPSITDGLHQMWGLLPSKNSDWWLPGYRVTGEGILFVFSKSQVIKWADENPALTVLNPVFRTSAMKAEDLSLAGMLAHTFGHAVMKPLSDRCGYPLAGIRDRVYDLLDGPVAVLVYTADGDSLGTLGGLVEHAEGKRLTGLVDDALEQSRWCTQDPVCNSAISQEELRVPGACHHCVLVPETSCESFNGMIDRALLHGSSDRGIVGFFS